MEPQIAKHQPMMSKQPDLGGWLGRQSLLTYDLLFCFDRCDVKEAVFIFPLMYRPISGSKGEMLCNAISLCDRALSLQ